MKKIILFLIITGGILFANENARFAGSYTRLGLGARSLAMGNTGVAAPARGYSFYYNPALAGIENQKVFSTGYNFMSLDRHIYFLSFSMKVPPGAGLSLGWLQSGTGELYSYNSIGENTGEINHSANAVYGSFSRQFSDKLSIGVTLKILLEYINDGSSEFDYSSTGVGGDIGIFYQATEDLAIGAVYKDIGSKLKANTEDLFERGGTTIDDFPRLLRVGAFYKTPVDWLNAAYDYELSSKGQHDQHIGFEALHGRNLALRLGLSVMDAGSPQSYAQYTFGTGLDFNFYKFVSHLDYAFISSVEDEGSSHLFSWEIYF